MTSSKPNDPNITVGELRFEGDVTGTVIVGNNNSVIKQEALPTQRRSMSPRPPRKPIGFVGRERELQQLEESIKSGQPVLVYGPDGIGKTSLVKQAANGGAATSKQDGVLFLEGLDEAGKLLGFDDLIQSMFSALFESQPRLKVDFTSARTYLSNTRPLVLLNSVSIPADELDRLLDLFPEAPILIATENSDTPENYETIFLGPMAQEDSLNLLVERSKSNDRETLAQIAALLENVPAALTVVANAISKQKLDVKEALSRLQSYTSTEKDKTKAALNLAFTLIFSTLTEEEQGMVLQAAASPAISTQRKWLESVAGGKAISEKLEELQLLQANSPRLRLMAGLRSFLLQGHDLSVQRERLLNYLLSELKTRWNDFEFIKDELGNLLGLLAWAVANGKWTSVAAMGRAIDPYLTLHGLWGAWRKTLGDVQRAAEALQDLALKGWVLHQLGTYEFGMGNLAAARSALEQAISIRQKIGDQIGLTYSKNNLQIIAPAAPPVARPANLMPWVLGGLAVVAIGAFLIFGNSPKDQTPPTAEPVIAASEVQVILSPSATPTATDTQTPTSSPSPTVTATFTPSPTGTPTVTPTYAVLSKVVVNDVAGCFHGPGSVYLNKGTRRIAGNTVDVLERAETDKGIWVYTRFSLPRTDASDPCWMDAKYLDVSETEVLSVAPVDPGKHLPLGVYYPDPSSSPIIVSVIRRDANTVVVAWSFYDVTEPDRESPTSARYLIEAWVCKAGEIVFQPIGVFFPTEGPYNPTASTNITDETGCSEPSHARLYLSWIDAYAGPVEITPWPQSETVLPIPTPTP